MYTSWQRLYYTNANQVWGNGQFQRANDATGTNFRVENHNVEGHLSLYWWWHGHRLSRSKQQWREPLVALLIVTKQDADKFNREYKNNYQWKQVDSVWRHTLSRFEATDSSNKQMTIQTSNFSYGVALNKSNESCFFFSVTLMPSAQKYGRSFANHMRLPPPPKFCCPKSQRIPSTSPVLTSIAK